jgi:hypothetical protein
MQSIFFFLYLLFACFFFPYISIVFLLVIMLSPCWFGWISFGPDLCVIDVYVTLAFRVEKEDWSRLLYYR